MHPAMLCYKGKKRRYKQNKNDSTLNYHARDFAPPTDPKVETNELQQTWGSFDGKCETKWKINNAVKHKQVLLCTKLIKMKNSKNNDVSAWCILDTGLTANFRIQKFANKLYFNVKDSAVSISFLRTFKCSDYWWSLLIVHASFSK